MGTARQRVLMLDYDGVIVDSTDYFRRRIISACLRHGLDQVSDRESFLRLFDVNLYEGMAAAGIPAETAQEVLEEVAANPDDAGVAYDAFDGMLEVLDELSRSAVVIVVTSNLAGVVRTFLARRDVRCIEEVLGCEEETSKIAKIRRVIAAHPGRVHYYVGDTVGDVLEGRAAGARTVAVTWGFHSAERLESVSPDFVVHSPPELLNLPAE